jgi:hypothetical protein
LGSRFRPKPKTSGLPCSRGEFGAERGGREARRWRRRAAKSSGVAVKNKWFAPFRRSSHRPAVAGRRGAIKIRQSFEARREAMNVRFLGALLLGVAGCAGQAYAHGGVSIDQGQCVMKIGPDTMTFTGYQPQKSREQFCDDIPDVGSTIIVLDAQQDELRDMALEIRILRNVGQKDDSENMDANTEIYVAPKKYKTGTLNFEYNFAKNGNFIGLVKARSDDGTKEYISRFPFAVGETANKNFYTAVVLGAAGLVGFGLYYKHAFIDKKKPSA